MLRNVTHSARLKLQFHCIYQYCISPSIPKRLVNEISVVLDEGEFTDARPLLDESLAINRELGDQTAIAYLLEDYAGLAAAEARPEKALKLASFTTALRESIGAPLPPSEQARVDRMIAPARHVLPESAATAEWEAGRSLALEQAIELALANS